MVPLLAFLLASSFLHTEGASSTSTPTAEPTVTLYPTSYPTSVPSYPPAPLYITKTIVGGALAGVLVLLMLYIAYGNYSYAIDLETRKERYREGFDALQAKIKENGGYSVSLEEDDDDNADPESMWDDVQSSNSKGEKTGEETDLRDLDYQDIHKRNSVKMTTENPMQRKGKPKEARVNHL